MTDENAYEMLLRNRNGVTTANSCMTKFIAPSYNLSKGELKVCCDTYRLITFFINLCTVCQVKRNANKNMFVCVCDKSSRTSHH